MNNIKNYRKKAGLTQKELAKKAQLNRSYISELENGKGNPTQETLQKLAKALGCDAKDLM